VLEFVILGFLFDDSRLHGWDLRTRIAALTGHVRPVADGTLYPAIKRMINASLVLKNVEAGAIAAPRHMLEILPAGKAKLLRMLREPEEVFITDENHWFCLLAFLRHLEDPAAQATVLRRRLAFLETPASFFYEGDKPLRAEDVEDPFRRGVLEIARVTSRTELAWLKKTIGELDGEAGHATVRD
jgi:DNA-binding PadR family transcriptional regulator